MLFCVQSLSAGKPSGLVETATDVSENKVRNEILSLLNSDGQIPISATLFSTITLASLGGFL